MKRTTVIEYSVADVGVILGNKARGDTGRQAWNVATYHTGGYTVVVRTFAETDARSYIVEAARAECGIKNGSARCDIDAGGGARVTFGGDA